MFHPICRLHIWRRLQYRISTRDTSRTERKGCANRGVVLALTLAELQPRLLLQMDAYAEEVDTMIDAALDAPSGCWGAELSGEVCTPGFVPGQAHFKNKFCAACREHGVAIPAQKIMVTAINGRFKNTNGRAPWSSGFRVVNQTAKCTGPNVVIFKDVPDEMDDQLVGPPDEWLRRDANGGAFVVFAVSKGTLVPVLAPAQLENLSLRRLMAESHACSPVADRATLLNAQLVLEQMASRRLDCERVGAGIVDEPLSDAETRALEALLEASRCASSALQSARPHGTMLSQATLPLDHAAPDDADGIFSFPPSPPHSARVQAAAATTQSTMQTKEMSLCRAAWAASVLALGLLSSWSAGSALFRLAPQLEGVGQAVLMFVVGAFAFNLAVLLVLCAAGRMRATFPAWPWPPHLLPRQMQPGGQCCFYQIQCDSRRTHVVSPSEL